jgi:hypothetical protein
VGPVVQNTIWFVIKYFAFTANTKAGKNQTQPKVSAGRLKLFWVFDIEMMFF